MQCTNPVELSCNLNGWQISHVQRFSLCTLQLPRPQYNARYNIDIHMQTNIQDEKVTVRYLASQLHVHSSWHQLSYVQQLFTYLDAVRGHSCMNLSRCSLPQYNYAYSEDSPLSCTSAPGARGFAPQRTQKMECRIIHNTHRYGIPLNQYFAQQLVKCLFVWLEGRQHLLLWALQVHCRCVCHYVNDIIFYAYVTMLLAAKVLEMQCFPHHFTISKYMGLI